jgi:hypothetical protein
MTHVVKKFSALHPNTLCTINDQDLLRAATTLKDEYPDDLSDAFPVQLVSFRAAMKHEIQKAKVSTIKELAHLLIVNYSLISSGFTDVITALLLFLTLPVTVASSERSFSKLKIIKNYLRNTMGQGRLRGLGLLSIEAAEAKKMDVEQLINDFSQIKARRKQF